MIYPADRLVWCVMLVVCPAAAVAGTVPAARPACIWLVTALMVAAVADAILAAGALDGIEFTLPSLVRLSRRRAGVVPVRIHNPGGKARTVRLGVVFPRQVETEQQELPARLPEGAPELEMAWPCTPVRRGSYPVTECRIETASRLGFWRVRASRPVVCELRVYPNLMAEGKKVTAVFLHRGAFGVHVQRQVGKGREFEKLREYVPGDDFGDLHWKTTAKRGRPVTKVFQAERTQEVYVVLDASRLTARPSGRVGDNILERFVNAALLLGLAAERQGDLFGLVAFSDRILSFVRAKNGKSHYRTCRDALYALHPSLVSPDYEELAVFLQSRLRRRALLVILSELDDPLLAESFERTIRQLRRRHVVIAGMIAPGQLRPIFSTSGVQVAGEIYDELAGHILWRRLRALQQSLAHAGVTLTLLDAETLALRLSALYLDVKRRQVL